MEVTEATGQNVEKSSSSSSETLNETVEKCIESQVINNDTLKTVSVSETVQVQPTRESGTTVVEIIEEVESDGEDVIEVIEIKKEMEPEKNENESSTEDSKKKIDIAPVVAKTVSQVNKSIDSIAMKAESSVEETVESTEEKGNEEEKEEEEEEEEDNEEEEEEEEKEEEEEGEIEEQPIEQYSEIVDVERQSHTDDGTSHIAEEKTATKAAVNDISVETADESNTCIATEKSELNEMKECTQEQTGLNQNAEVLVANKLAEMQLTEDKPIDNSKNHENMANINKLQTPITMERPQSTLAQSERKGPVATKSVSEDTTNSHHEKIRSQLQEIVSDVDRAIEESYCFPGPPNMSSTITSQNNINTELFKRTSNSVILNPPSYFYQDDKTPITTSPSMKAIDLKKIFTPANDAEEIVPHKNRKNDSVSLNGYSEQRTPEQNFGDQTYSIQHHESKIPLKLVMDPRGVIQDVHTQGITFDHNSGMLSPDKCAELVSALHTDSPKGKGAELFAKRRKRSEKWIVDETSRLANNPSCTSYSAGPAPIYDTNQFNYTDQQPWENPREATHTDFLEEKHHQSSDYNYNQDNQALPYSLPRHTAQPLRRNPNSQRDLAYKPSVPQGWNAPPANLPNEMFTPPEIPLSGYTPPQTEIYLPKSTQITSSYYPHQYENTRTSTDLYYQPNNTYHPKTESYHQFEPILSCKNVQASQIHSKNSVPNFTPKPFTPSPIAHEKLAVFEPNKPNQPQAPVIRRPLTIPNQAVHNISQNSMGSNSSYDPNQNITWRNSNDHKIFNRLTTSSFMTQPANYNSANFVKNSPCLTKDLSYQENHNRAARGWGQSKDFYRPISFTRLQPAELPYTDF